MKLPKLRHGLRFEGPDWHGDLVYRGWGIDGPDMEWEETKGLREFFQLWRREDKPLSRRRSWFGGGHGGDEYGNCSLFFRCPWFGVTWDYPSGHYQTDVELPEIGENAWVDRTFFNEKQ